MQIRRKDYQPLADSHLDGLRQQLLPILGTAGGMTLPAKTLYWLVMEVIDSREEIFRLQLCETVDKIIADELDEEEEDLLAFRWPDDFTFGGEEPSSGAYKPAFPCKETQRLNTSHYPATVDPNPEIEGRRMPRVG